MIVSQLVDFVERLNLSHHKTLLGQYFPEIIALLSIVFGGAFLLFGWRHHEYFLGVTGLLAGAWAGLVLKNQIVPAGSSAPFFYLMAGAAAGAFIGAYCRRFVGILLGGFTALLFIAVLGQALSGGRDPHVGTLCAVFLLGGGMGGLFPRFFFVLDSSLIGSSFVTYGVSLSVLAPMSALTPKARVLLHLLVFLPLFIFGMVYQGLAEADGKQLRVIVEAPPARKPSPKPAAKARAAEAVEAE